ncbi:tyrosine-type recombinase/integrase [Dyadobacter frigoris]|uniref:tyrosine-type recombinase/integrase n=1 Tax=Dyadobacter frigoris TaxID=2576211 RepID=UPI001C6FFA3B|nr:tyrosine-type recombinase/integrase [Dyadobacter frigoris]
MDFIQKQRVSGAQGASGDYVTVVQRACDKVTGFRELCQELARSISINGKSQSALTNYSRQLAHLALHYGVIPLELEPDQVMDYLHLVKSQGNLSQSFFNFTVHGMRYACKMRGLDYSRFALPTIKSPRKLPVVLNGSEMKALLTACNLLKHRIMNGLLYGCGLRTSELQQLKTTDIDLERGMVHVRQGKGSKDRYLPLGKMLCRGLKRYILEEVPVDYLFVNRSGEAYSRAGG